MNSPLHRFTKPKNVSLTGPSRWSAALRIFMLLAAWQGPMPWCHCHGTLSDSDAAAAPPWLAQHLQTHHASVSPLSNIFFGWHMHAVFPGSSTDDPTEPKKAEHQFRPPTDSAVDCLAEQLARAADGLSLSFAERFELPGRNLTGSGEPDAGRAIHFFDRFAPSLPLPLRFSVARC